MQSSNDKFNEIEEVKIYSINDTNEINSLK